MASSAKKWPWIFVVLGLLIPLLQPVMPEVVSDYRLFLVSTMIIAAIAVLMSAVFLFIISIDK